MDRPKISKNRLLKSSGHLAYEIQLFHHAYLSCLNPTIFGNDMLRSCSIETFLLHGRNLYGFFYRRKGINPRPDDVIVEDFLSAESLICYKRGRCSKSHMDKLFPLKRVNKELAHLSYYRLRKNNKTKKWRLSEIHESMGKTINSFLKSSNKNIHDVMLKYKYVDIFN